MRSVWIGVAALVVVGCGNKTIGAPEVANTAPKAPVDPWVLTCVDPEASEPALLWNGLIGLRLGRDGSGVGADGKALPMFAIDAYQPGGEEKIVPLPSPLRPAPHMGPYVATLKGATDYKQELDMRTGVLTTSWRQPIPDGRSLLVSHVVAVHPTQRILAEKWEYGLRLKPDEQNPLIPALNSTRGATQTNSSQDSVDMAVEAGGSNDSGLTKGFISQTIRVGRSLSSDRKAVAHKTIGFDEVLAESKRIWAKRWETDIEIDGPPEDQQAVRSWLFYLRSATQKSDGLPFSPFGLSSDTYSGHVFWDADIWAFPALALVEPDEARSIANYRLAHARMAAVNGQQWLAAGRPTASKKLGPATSTGTVLKFPWESSVSGKETVPGPSRFEDHITGSVAFSLAQAAALGLAPQDKVQAILKGAKRYFELRSEPGSSGREVKQVMSPDENHIGDNDLYTNLLADWLEAGGKWATQPVFHLPKDAKSFLTYDNDALRGYKQAAAVLSIYPLQYPPAEAQAKAMMDRFADKTIKNGPAMSDSVNATIWARLGEDDRAYKAWKSSWQPFMTGPLCLFSEKRSKQTAYFTTGAAGCLQTVLNGFLGFRLDSKNRPNEGWSVRLLGDSVLSEAPHIPKLWKKVKFKNFTVLGGRYTLTVTQAPNGGTSKITHGD